MRWLVLRASFRSVGRDSRRLLAGILLVVVLLVALLIGDFLTGLILERFKSMLHNPGGIDYRSRRSIIDIVLVSSCHRPVPHETVADLQQPDDEDRGDKKQR
jgi:hypothetical protein